MEDNNIESMKDKIGVQLQPKDHHDDDDDDVFDLNKAITGAITRNTDQDDDNSPIDPADITSEQQQNGVLLDDQTYEQLYSRLQQRSDAAINALIDVKSDLARLLASDISHDLANNEKIYSYSYHTTHTGITIDNYNTVVGTISNLKSTLKS